MTDYRIKLKALERLKILKTMYTYRELQEALGIRIPVLARYISYKNLPSLERSKKIIKYYEKIDFSKFIKEKIDLTGNLINISSLLADVSLLKQIALQIDVEADKVLTMAVDGIPFGTIVAETLGAKIVYVKEKEETGVQDFLQTTATFGPSIYQKTFYLPKKLLSKKDNVLLVDDILRSGNTFDILIDIAKQANARVVGGAVLIAKKEKLKPYKKKLKNFYAFYLF